MKMEYHFDYFLKDHLGNVRTVLTDEVKADTYMCTMEEEHSVLEHELFEKLEDLVEEPESFGGDGENMVQRLGASNGAVRSIVLGAGLVLKVMAGDHVAANVLGRFNNTEQNITPNSSVPLQQLIANFFTNGILHSGKGDVAGALPGVVLSGITNFLQNQPNNEDQQSAYLNWIMLDEEQLKVVTSGTGFTSLFSQAGTTGGGVNTILQANNGDGIDVTRNGFLYIYISNTNTNFPVYFDNLHVEIGRAHV